MKNAGTIDMSASPDPFGASHRTGLLHGGTFHTHLRVETLAGNGLKLCLRKHQVPSVIPGDVPEYLCLQRIGNRVVQLAAQFALNVRDICCHQSPSPSGLQ
ncbi:hypothetical protein EVC45_31075 [Paraburkholderia sp. UYCP14C]|uniref:hypothetical protein n=1 Tax=Paraburkholderia sp. UYCP14C TaxID=2511130 RepID=UPI001020851D|nr:hypothetical protein [Paraburkholderia sp. UYCP14C]RZF25857.1 hypothetical protein EVC45_31075 [Paraburkholderia sp. UYCP14C]